MGGRGQKAVAGFNPRPGGKFAVRGRDITTQATVPLQFLPKRGRNFFLKFFSFSSHSNKMICASPGVLINAVTVKKKVHVGFYKLRQLKKKSGSFQVLHF